MSDSCKVIENDYIQSNNENDEPLDPRIPVELERANAATIEINNLETQLDNAQKLFQVTFTNCKQRLTNLAKTLGRCVERARPYYDACKQAEEARIETRKAAQEYQSSVELCYAAKENLSLAESQLSKSDDVTRQEYVDHLSMKVMETEKDKNYYERIHEEKSRLYQEYEQQRIKLYRSLARMIVKSKPYFDAKFKAENELKNQKSRIEDVQKAIHQAKKVYRLALNNLEQISDEIHMKRKNQILLNLPKREPGVGAEKPDEFIELPHIEFTKVDLSDEPSSDDDISQSMDSLAVNKNTICIYPSSGISLSNTNSPLTTHKFEKHQQTQMHACANCENDQLQHKEFTLSKSDRMKSTRMLKTNETPLLSHLLGTHKYHSDPNLNATAKQ